MRPCWLLGLLAAAQAFAPPAARLSQRALALRAEAPKDSEVVLSDDPLVQRIQREVAEATGGKSLDDLLNPATVINLERELIALRSELEALPAGAAEQRAEIEQSIATKEQKSYREKRSVMKDWLKAVFRGQAVLAGGISFLAVYDLVPGFSPGLDLSLRVLGFWSWWLFTVPSLRSIKPLDSREKRALDAAFLLTLVASLAAPAITKDPPTIWCASAAARAPHPLESLMAFQLPPSSARALLLRQVDRRSGRRRLLRIRVPTR